MSVKMAIFFHSVTAWMVLLMAFKMELVNGKDEYTKNKQSMFSLEERNLLALGRIFETLQKLAEPQSKCKKEDATNEKLLSLISAVENTQNSVKIIAEAAKKSATDTSSKFETVLTAIQDTQNSVEVFAKSTADAITMLQQTIVKHIPASSTDMNEGTTTPVPPMPTEMTEGTSTPSEILSTVNTDLCESPYILIGSECFRISRHERSWNAAKEQCLREGASLAVPQNLDLLRHHIRFTGNTADYWIGGHKEDGNWTWITGDPIEDEWDRDQPSNRPNEDCLDFRAGRWPSLNDYECQTSQRYICERPYTGTVSTTPEPVDCSLVGAINVGQKCLSISEDELNWNDSATACTNKGGQLLSLQETKDIYLVHDYILTNHDDLKFWIGGSDIANEGQWVWMDGQSFQEFPWRYPEPNNANGDEDCLQWGHARHFNDAPCDNQCRYICEIDVSSSTAETSETETETTLQDLFTDTSTEDSSSSDTQTTDYGITSESPAI